MMTLIDIATGRPINIGDTATTFRGETVTVTGWREPHKPSSTGHVSVTGEHCHGEYYPSVIGAQFVDVPNECETCGAEDGNHTRICPHARPVRRRGEAIPSKLVASVKPDRRHGLIDSAKARSLPNVYQY